MHTRHLQFAYAVRSSLWPATSFTHRGHTCCFFRPSLQVCCLYYHCKLQLTRMLTDWQSGQLRLSCFLRSPPQDVGTSASVPPPSRQMTLDRELTWSLMGHLGGYKVSAACTSYSAWTSCMLSMLAWCSPVDPCHCSANASQLLWLSSGWTAASWMCVGGLAWNFLRPQLKWLALCLPQLNHGMMASSSMLACARG